MAMAMVITMVMDIAIPIAMATITTVMDILTHVMMAATPVMAQGVDPGIGDERIGQGGRGLA